MVHTMQAYPSSSNTSTPGGIDAPDLATTAGLLVEEGVGYIYEPRFANNTTIDDEGKGMSWENQISLRALPSLEISHEAAYEDWIDQLSMAIRERTQTVDHRRLIRVISSILPSTARVEAFRIEEIYKSDVETYLSALAKSLFPKSAYAYHYFTDFLLKYTQDDLQNIVSIMHGKLSRYVRLCWRWNINQSISRGLLEESVLRLLTHAIKTPYRAQATQKLLEDLTYFRLYYKVEPSAVYAAKVDNSNTMAESNFIKARRPTRECYGCGEMHWRKDCPYVDAQCPLCRKKGHKQELCRMTVLDAGEGVPPHRVYINHRGGAKVNISAINSDAKKLELIEGFVDKTQDAIKRKNAAATDKRREDRLTKEVEDKIKREQLVAKMSNLTDEERKFLLKSVHFVDAIENYSESEETQDFQ